MKIIDKIKASSSSKPFFTFEFFPPRTDDGFDNLLDRISRLRSLNPLAISVTWGAGGSTKDRSLELAGLTQEEHGIDTILHLTCTNMEKGLVDEALRNAKSRGIQNILALRGDPPRGEEYWIPTDPRFSHAIDLLSYIKSTPEFASHFCVGVAAYPDGHADHEVNEETEIRHLKAKVDAGADFIITQLFYDVDNFLSWQAKVRAAGINVPIIPGILPLQSYTSFLRLTKLCGARVPPSLQAELEPLCHDDQKIKDFGVSLAIQMIHRLTKEGGISGVHFCTLNLERSVQRVLEGLGWVGGNASPSNLNRLITDLTDGSSKSDWLITPTDATSSAAQHFASKPVQESTDQGKGELNHASTWDEFPNGRFGDYKSPAFGINQDPWNAGPNPLRPDSVSQWGHPKSIADLTDLFMRHLQSKISTTPFSPGSLSPESLLILNHLEKLTSRGWWTVGSQPAVDGAPSDDETYGWGPRGGYVFQKGFVEFFAETADVDALAKRIGDRGGGWVEFFASNAKGDLRTNVPEGARNAVTWGVFPGKEIAQSTIIEKDSFLSWKDEAFGIWSQWALLYPPNSGERQLIESIGKERWLVSIVHHNFKDPNGLWTFLFDE